jgi:hypothetical protein
MKRFVYFAAAILLAALPFAAQPAKAAVSVSIQIGDHYRGASLAFHSEPRVIVVPGTQVFVTRNYDRDLYRFRNHWYFVENGFWYRSKTWRGPFRHVQFQAVPREIRRIPARYRQHWYAPYRDHDRRWEQARARDREYNRDWDRVRDEWDRDDRDRDRDRDGRRDRDRRERG